MCFNGLHTTIPVTAFLLVQRGVVNVAVFRYEVSRCTAVEYSSSVLLKVARILLYALLDNIHHAFCYAITLKKKKKLNLLNAIFIPLYELNDIQQ